MLPLTQFSFVASCALGAAALGCGTSTNSSPDEAATGNGTGFDSGTGTEVPPARVCPADMVVGDICVDPSEGKDPPAGSANDGSVGAATAPVKTLTAALSLVGRVGTGRTAYLLSGAYDDNGGERFPLTVPEGIALVGIAPVAADKLDGTSAASALIARLTIPADGELRFRSGSSAKNVALFASGVGKPSVSTDGTVLLTNVVFAGRFPGSTASGDVTFDASRIEPGWTNEFASTLRLHRSIVTISEMQRMGVLGDAEIRSSQFNVQGGQLSFASPDALDTLAGGRKASLEDSSITGSGSTDGPPDVVVSRDLTVTGGKLVGVSLSQNEGVLSISGATVGRTTIACSGSCSIQKTQFSESHVSASANDDFATSLAIDECVFDGALRDEYAVASTTSTSIHGTTFRSVYGSVLGRATYRVDLGDGTRAGMNVFEGTPTKGVHFALVDPAFHDKPPRNAHASGNTWLPNENGADSSGHFATGRNVTDALSGPNIQKSSDTTIEF